MIKIFIDGSSGTTGLGIHERLAQRGDIALIDLPQEKSKDPGYIRDAFKEADIAFLCLPDAAAKEAYLMARDLKVRLIDTSTAHRTTPGWVYGFPELKDFRPRIKDARFVANPGCHASGFLALVTPLIEAEFISQETLTCCTSITGYSGGGKTMISVYESQDRPRDLKSPGLYGLTQFHKHLQEMQQISGLNQAPAFFPIVSDYYAGMETIIPLFKKDLLKGSHDDIRKLYADYYRGKVVHFEETMDLDGFVYADRLSGYDDMMIAVAGNDERITLLALFDNLGKGASGAAIQNMNIMLGTHETRGLKLHTD